MINIVELDVVTNLTDFKASEITGGRSRILCQARISGFPEELREELLGSKAAFNDFCPSWEAPITSVGGYTGPGTNSYGGGGRLP